MCRKEAGFSDSAKHATKHKHDKRAIYSVNVCTRTAPTATGALVFFTAAFHTLVFFVLVSVSHKTLALTLQLGFDIKKKKEKVAVIRLILFCFKMIRQQLYISWRKDY